MTALTSVVLVLGAMALGLVLLVVFLVAIAHEVTGHLAGIHHQLTRIASLLAGVERRG